MGTTLDREKCEYTIECDFCHKTKKVYAISDKKFSEASEMIGKDGWKFRKITKIANGVLYPDTIIALCRICSTKKKNRAAFWKYVMRVTDKEALAGFKIYPDVGEYVDGL